MEHPIKMDDLGVPLFSETAIYLSIIYLRIYLNMTLVSVVVVFFPVLTRLFWKW